MALRHFARQTAGLVTREAFAVRCMSTVKVNQVVGAPMEVFERKVVIFSPARAACQQGKAQIGGWKIHPVHEDESGLFFTGWTSSGDPMAHQLNSILNFDSKEAAMAFCEKHGWEYEIMEPQKQGVGASTIPGAGKAGTKPKSYGDNFSSSRKGIPVWPHPGFK